VIKSVVTSGSKWRKVQAQEIPRPVIDTPRGLFPAKVDDKGRLKLPATFSTFLTALQASKVYITSTDRVTAKIYSMESWASNVKLLENLPGEKRQWGKDILFLADELGEEGSVDGQGRLLLPTNLRRALGLESSEVWLQAGDGLINIYSQQVMEARRQRALENLQAKVEFAEGEGLK
jgi:MraZ protein